MNDYMNEDIQNILKIFDQMSDLLERITADLRECIKTGQEIIEQSKKEREAK